MKQILDGASLQVCGECEDAKMPDWLREAWHLVEEVVLLEEHISLLKLAVKLDAVYQPQPDPQLEHPSQVAHSICFAHYSLNPGVARPT